MTAARLDFPLASSPERDAAIRPVVDRAVRFLVDHVGAGRLDAVILTGSLSRGEGSVLVERGRPRLLGDVEFLAIVRPPARWGETRRRLAELARVCSAECAALGALATIEYTPAGLEYLRRNIRPCIFAYDLLGSGKVVWGRPDILGEALPFPATAIPAEDAVELVMNRMIELIALQATPERASGTGQRYMLVKTILDLSGSLLAFTGRYVSSYAARPGRTAALLDTHTPLRDTLENPGAFTADLEEAARLKLAPTPDLLARADGAGLERVTGWTKAIWRWQMQRLTGQPAATVDELVSAYLRRDSARTRLRGWLKFWTHPFRPRGTVSIPRTARYFFRTSPRRLTYAAALMAYFAATGEPMAAGSGRIAALLPVRVGSAHANAATAAIDVWRWLIRNN